MKKNTSTHHKQHKKGIGIYYPVAYLVDGTHGYITAFGTLEDDGSFYEAGKGWAKIIADNGNLVYSPTRLIVDTFGVITWR